MKSRLKTITLNNKSYQVLIFVCPGCISGDSKESGVHMLPVNVPNDVDKTSWSWNGNLEQPTLSPTILTTGPFRCHSSLKNGIFKFLIDSQHPLVGKEVPIPDLPKWAEDID